MNKEVEERIEKVLANEKELLSEVDELKRDLVYTQKQLEMGKKNLIRDLKRLPHHLMIPVEPEKSNKKYYYLGLGLIIVLTTIIILWS